LYIVSSVFLYMRDSVQVPRRFNGVYIVILLLYLQHRLSNSKGTFTVFPKQLSSQPNNLIKKVPCCDVWPYCSMIIKP